MKEALEVEAVDALLEAGRRLREVDPAAFAKVLAAVRALVAVHDRPGEPAEVFASRIEQICPRGFRGLN